MKTMLITGASSGIGRALAVRAARAGYAVYAVGRNQDALDALRRTIEAANGFVAVETADIAIPANAAGIVARTLARFGTIDVLVNNAGFVSSGDLSAQSDAELQRQFGTHVIGPVALVREARDALRSSRGHVFMLGSGVARVPVGALGAYPPAKAALRSATAILRRELRPLGIGMTYVDPGAVDTPFMKRAGMPGAPAALLVSPEQVARTILIAVGQRPRDLNAVGWQTALVGLAEFFPRAVDALLARAPGLIGGAGGPALGTDASGLSTAGGTGPPPEAADAKLAAPEPAVAITSEEPVTPDPSAAPSFETALEPHRRRMEKLSLRESFVRDVLVPGAHLDLGEIALRWAGMPNKNERAITEEVLEALADAQFLERTDDLGYRVVRAP
jgi:short-subunit dehydrogenase